MHKKNMAEKNRDAGNVLIDSGTTMNTSPGPSAATSFTWTPFRWAIYPRMEKMTKPAKKLVAELTVAVRRASRYTLLWNLL